MFQQSPIARHAYHRALEHACSGISSKVRTDPMKQCFLGESLLAQPPPQSAPLPSGGLLPPRPLPIKPGPEDVDVATEDKSDWKTILLTSPLRYVCQDTFQNGRQTRKLWEDIHQNHQSHQTVPPGQSHTSYQCTQS